MIIRGKNRYVGAHPIQNAENTVPGGIDAHILNQKLGTGGDASRSKKIGGRGNIAGYTDFLP